MLGCTSDSPTAPENNQPDEDQDQNAEDEDIASTSSSGHNKNAVIEAPSGLTAIIICCSPKFSRAYNTIELSWQDNSATEQGFIIERMNSNDRNWRQIASVNAGVEAYSDCGLLPETYYFYKVKAFKERIHSQYSNIALAKTGDDGFDPKPPK